MRRVNNEGLKSVYEGDSHPLVKQWIRQIMATTLLPAFAVPLIWETLKQPPTHRSTGSGHENCSTDDIC